MTKAKAEKQATTSGRTCNAGVRGRVQQEQSRGKRAAGKTANLGSWGAVEGQIGMFEQEEG